MAPYYRASDKSRKSNFVGIFRDRFAEIFGANFAEKQSLKNGRFRGGFLGKFREKSIDFWADLRSVFNVFNRGNHLLF